MLSFNELSTLFSEDKAKWQTSFSEFSEARSYLENGGVSAEVKAALERKGLPPVSENIFKVIIKSYLGRKFSSATQVKIFGKQEEDAPLAELLNSLIYSFTQKPDFVKQTKLRDTDLLLGCGVVELNLSKNGAGDFVITPKRLNPLNLVIDARSVEYNASDSKRFSKFLSVSSDEARRLWAGKNVIYSQDNGVYQRASVVESWVCEGGVWNRYFWQEGGEILGYEETPLCFGKTHPFVVAKFECDEEGRFYGLFRDLKPLQDFINYSANRLTKLLNVNSYLYESGALDNPRAFSLAVSRGDNAIAVPKGSLERGLIREINHGSQIAQINALIREKRDLLSLVSGVNDAYLNLEINANSQMVQHRKELSALALGAFFGSVEVMECEIYAKMVEYIKHYFTKTQICRIADQKQVSRYIAISGSDFAKIRVGEFDVIYHITPKMSNEFETFAHWSELLKSGVLDGATALQLLPQILKATNSPLAGDVAEVVEGRLNAPADEMSQKMRELEMLKLQAQIEMMQAQSAKFNAQGGLIDTTTLKTLDGESSGKQQKRVGTMTIDTRS